MGRIGNRVKIIINSAQHILCYFILSTRQTTLKTWCSQSFNRLKILRDFGALARFVGCSYQYVFNSLTKYLLFIDIIALRASTFRLHHVDKHDSQSSRAISQISRAKQNHLIKCTFICSENIMYECVRIINWVKEHPGINNPVRNCSSLAQIFFAR